MRKANKKTSDLLNASKSDFHIRELSTGCTFVW